MKALPYPVKILLLSGLLGFTGGCRMFLRREDRPLPPPPERGLRLPPRGSPLTSFEQTAGWSVHSRTGRARLDKDRAPAIWGEYAGVVRFTPRQAGPHSVEIRPAEPWRVNAPFNMITFWVWHEPAAPHPSGAYELVLHGTGPRNQSREWVMPYRPGPGWQMLHLRMDAEDLWPMTFTHISWRFPDGIEGPQDLFLENLRVYQESVARIPREIQFIRPHDYAPAFAPRRAGSVLLDFPPRPGAFRPLAPAERFVNTLEQIEPNLYRFLHQSGSLRLEYRVHLSGNFPAISVRLNDVDLEQVWRGADVHSQGDPPVFRLSRIDEGRLILQYAEGLRFSLSLQGRTLELEAHSLNETFSGMDLGGLEKGGAQRLERLELPFMRLSANFPWPLAWGEAEETRFFISVIPDWWFSMAGEVLPPQAEGIALGRMVYPPRWKGGRNVFRERVYFTVSPNLEDVLPGPSAPPALMRARAGEIFFPSETPRTLRLIHMQPTDPDWREDDLARDSEGNWRGFAHQRFFMKSARFQDLALFRLQEQRGQGTYTHAYMPWLSRFPPWRYTDFDARVLGAGTFAQTWAEVGALLQQTAAEVGIPLLGDGGSEWLYSGFMCGLIPNFPNGIQSFHPFLPHIAHQNIAPYTALMGMGDTAGFRFPDEETVPPEALFWRQIAAQIAYTAAGRIPDVEDGALRDLAHNILAPVHERFTRSRVVRLLYWNGSRLQTAGEAVADGSLALSMLYFRLESGEEVWVNGSRSETWLLQIRGESYTLPPFGFFMLGEDFSLMRVQTAEGSAIQFQGAGASWRVDKPDIKNLSLEH